VGAPLIVEAGCSLPLRLKLLHYERERYERTHSSAFAKSAADIRKLRRMSDCTQGGVVVLVAAAVSLVLMVFAESLVLMTATGLLAPSKFLFFQSIVPFVIHSLSNQFIQTTHPIPSHPHPPQISGFFLLFAPPSSTNSCPLKNPAPITYSTISAKSSPLPTLPAGCCL